MKKSFRIFSVIMSLIVFAPVCHAADLGLTDPEGGIASGVGGMVIATQCRMDDGGTCNLAGTEIDSECKGTGNSNLSVENASSMDITPICFLDSSKNCQLTRCEYRCKGYGTITKSETPQLKITISGSCRSCPTGATCTGQNETSQGNSRYVVISNGYKCYSDRYDTGQTCEVCPEHATCDGTSRIVCADTYTLVEEENEYGFKTGKQYCRPPCPENGYCPNNNFERCNDGYYGNINACNKCPDNSECPTGDIADSTFTCNDGFLKDSINKTCINCLLKNAKCTGGNFESCLTGYYGTGIESCSPCPSEDGRKSPTSNEGANQSITDCYYTADGTETENNNELEDSLGWYDFEEACYYSE